MSGTKSNPLISAVQRNDLNSVRRLLAVDANNINSQGGPDGATPLFYAAKAGSLEMVEALLDCRQCHCDIGSNEHITPFSIACSNGNLFVAQYLADHGCNVAKSDVNGRSAFHFSALNNQYSVMKYMSQKLSPNIDMEAKDESGYSAFHLAVLHNHHRIVSLVIKNRCDINTHNANGETPLWTACHLGLLELTKILIHEILLHGDIHWLDEVNKECKSAVYEAVRGKHLEILQYLVKAGADVNICKSKDGKLPFTGDNPLLLALKLGKPSFVTTLLQAKGCNIDATFRGQNVTPLHWAVILDSQLVQQWREDPAMNEQLGSCPIHYIQILKLLLLQKPIVDTLDEKYHTPLHTACSHGNLAVVKMLTEYGADIDKRCKKYLNMDNEGRLYLTPIDIGLLKGQIEVVKYLVKSGAQFVLADWMKVPELQSRLLPDANLLTWIKENR